MRARLPFLSSRLSLTVNFVFLKHSELTVRGIINGTYTGNVFYLATRKVIALSQNMGFFFADIQQYV